MSNLLRLLVSLKGQEHQLFSNSVCSSALLVCVSLVAQYYRLWPMLQHVFQILCHVLVVIFAATWIWILPPGCELCRLVDDLHSQLGSRWERRSPWGVRMGRHTKWSTWLGTSLLVYVLLIVVWSFGNFDFDFGGFDVCPKYSLLHLGWSRTYVGFLLGGARASTRVHGHVGVLLVGSHEHVLGFLDGQLWLLFILERRLRWLVLRGLLMLGAEDGAIQGTEIQGVLVIISQFFGIDIRNELTDVIVSTLILQRNSFAPRILWSPCLVDGEPKASLCLSLWPACTFGYLQTFNNLIVLEI